MFEAHLVEFVSQAAACRAVDFVYRQGYGLAQAAQHLREVAIGARELAAAVDQKDDLIGSLESEAGLAQNLAGDQFIVIGDDSAGIDQLKSAAAVVAHSVDTVACNTRLVADDRSARSQDGIEQSRFADV